MMRFGRNYFMQDVLEVAPQLLGSDIVIVKDAVLSRYTIVEVEAYRGEEDMACHASKGRTRRTEIMYHTGGHIYVYLIYGMYWMLNIVTGEKDNPQAILIRGVINCSGPGRVGKLLGIDKTYYGEDLTCSNKIWIEKHLEISSNNMVRKSRVGIDYAREEWKNKNWRYILTI